jgi:hypothetical protein
MAQVIRRPSDAYWLARVGWFIIRLPADVQRKHLSDFLADIASASRPPGASPASAAERIIRLRTPWLRAPILRRRDTCYVRALTLYRFLDGGRQDVQFKVGAEWFDQPGGTLRGHAWVTLGDSLLEAPLDAAEHARLLPIDLGPGTRAASSP